MMHDMLVATPCHWALSLTCVSQDATFAFAKLRLVSDVNAGRDHMLPLPTAFGLLLQAAANALATLNLSMIAGRHHSAPNRD